MKPKQLRPGPRPAPCERRGRWLQITLMAALALFAVLVPQAGSDSSDSAVGDAFTDGGIQYKVVSESPREAEVAPGTYTGAVTIPSSATYVGNAYSVISIGARAFKDCNGLTSVDMPSSVTTVGDSAFSGCTYLTSVNLADGLKTIGNHAFSGCTYLTSVNLADGLKTIGNHAFSDCTSLASVNIPSSVTTFGNYTFSNCTSLESVTLADGLKVIGSGMFNGCKALKSVSIPPSVTTVERYAFFGCTSLESVTLADGLETIKEYAFAQCTSLKSVTVPGSVSSTGSNIFWNCMSLQSIVFSEGVKRVGNYICKGCKELTSVTLPDTLETVGEEAFYECKKLSTVSIPSGVTTISIRAFASTGVSSLNLSRPNFIGEGAFSNCTSLTSVTFSGLSPPLNINRGAFAGSYNTAELHLEDCTSWSSVKSAAFAMGTAGHPLTCNVYCGKVVPSASLGSSSDANTTFVYWAKTRFNSEGTIHDTINEKYGSTYVLPADPVRPGYRFAGWFTEESGGTRVTDSTILTLPVPYTAGLTDLYARWDPIVLTVTVAAVCVYDGQSQNPAVTVKDGETTLDPADYETVYTDNVGAGTARVTVTGRGDYLGASGSVTFEIARRPLDVTAEDKVVTFPSPAPAFTAAYSGLAPSESPAVLGGSLAFACAYDGSTYAASFPIVPSGLSSPNYDISFLPGTLTVTNSHMVKPVASDRVYNGGLQVGVLAGEGYVLSGTPAATAAGPYAAVATPLPGNVWEDGTSAPLDLTWSILPLALSWEMFLLPGEQTWRGAPVIPGTVTAPGYAWLSERLDYRASYSGNTAPGIGRMTVHGVGSCTGEVVFEFPILVVVVYDSNGGFGAPPASKGLSVEMGGLGGLSREGFDAVAWNTARDGSGQSYGAGEVYSGPSITLYATWKPPVPLPSDIDTTADSMHLPPRPDREYSLDGGRTWIAGGRVGGLDPDTPYRILERVPGTADSLPSDPTEQEVRTDPAPPLPRAAVWVLVLSILSILAYLLYRHFLLARRGRREEEETRSGSGERPRRLRRGSPSEGGGEAMGVFAVRTELSVADEAQGEAGASGGLYRRRGPGR